MKKIIREIKWFFRQCRRSFDYAKHAWGGYDWDYRYSVDMFMFSLERLANNLESNKAYSVNAARDAKQIRRVLNLMKQVYDEDFACAWQDKLKELYGDTVIDFRTEPNTNGTHRLLCEYETWPNAAEIEIVKNWLVDKCNKKQEKAHALVWRLVNNHIRYWWD